MLGLLHVRFRFVRFTSLSHCFSVRSRMELSVRCLSSLLLSTSGSLPLRSLPRNRYCFDLCHYYFVSLLFGRFPSVLGSLSITYSLRQVPKSKLSKLHSSSVLFHSVRLFICAVFVSIVSKRALCFGFLSKM